MMWKTSFWLLCWYLQLKTVKVWRGYTHKGKRRYWHNECNAWQESIWDRVYEWQALLEMERNEAIV